MYIDYIISPDDPRYKNLTQIFSYEFDKLSKYGNSRQVWYFIPPELVTNDYITSKVTVVKDISLAQANYPTWIDRINWIASNRFPEVLAKATGLTTQEWFDLLALKNNDRLKRPRCHASWCRKPIKFDRISHGYGHTGEYQLSDIHFCSPTCKLNWHNLMGIGMNSVESNIRKAKSQFLSKGNPDDICILYLTWTEDGLKYGITSNLNDRYLIEYLNGHEYQCAHIIFKSTRVKIADIEEYIKNKFNGSEYLEKSQLHELMKIIRQAKTKFVI